MCRREFTAYLPAFILYRMIAAAHSIGINTFRPTYPLTLRPQHIDLISPVYPSKIVRIISTTIHLEDRILVMESGEIELHCNGGTDSANKKWNTTNRDRSRGYIHDNGNLEINNIQLNDDGLYTCYYKLGTSADMSMNDIISHTAHYINVYEMPTLCHNISWKYLLLECDNQLEIAYRNWLLSKILDEHLSANNTHWQLKYFKINCVQVEKTVMELQVEICMGYSFSSIRTRDMFVEFADIGLLNNKLDNLHRILKQRNGLDSFEKLEYQSYTFNMMLSSFCQSGRHIRFNVCIACPLGHYSVVPAIECLACREGYYNDKLSSSYCLHCPKGTISKVGATSLAQCVEPLWITILWYLLFILPSVIGWAFALGVCLLKRRTAKRKTADLVKKKEIERKVVDLAKIEEDNKKTDLAKEKEFGKNERNFKMEKMPEDKKITDLPKDEFKEREDETKFVSPPKMSKFNQGSDKPDDETVTATNKINNSSNKEVFYQTNGRKSSSDLISENELTVYENVNVHQDNTRLSKLANKVSDPRTAEPIKNYTEKQDEEIVSQNKLKHYYSRVPPEVDGTHTEKQDEEIASQNKLKHYYSRVPPAVDGTLTEKQDEEIASQKKLKHYYSRIPPEVDGTLTEKQDEEIASQKKLKHYYSRVPPEVDGTLYPQIAATEEVKDDPYYSQVEQNLQNKSDQISSLVEDEPYYSLLKNSPESSTEKSINKPVYAKISKDNNPYTPMTYQSKQAQIATTDVKKPHYYSQVALEQQRAFQLKKQSNTINKMFEEGKEKKMRPIDENLLFE